MKYNVEVATLYLDHSWDSREYLVNTESEYSAEQLAKTDHVSLMEEQNADFAAVVVIDCQEIK